MKKSPQQLQKFKPRPMKSKLSPKRIKIINAIRAETIKRANQQFVKQTQQQKKPTKKSKKNEPNAEKENVSQQKKSQNSQKTINDSHLSKGLRKTEAKKLDVPGQKQKKRVKFDDSKTEVYVSATMYKFEGQRSVRPFSDPDLGEGLCLRTRNRSQSIREQDLQDSLYSEEGDEDYEEEKPKKTKKAKQNIKENKVEKNENTGDKGQTQKQENKRQDQKKEQKHEQTQYESFLVSRDESVLDISVADIDISVLEGSQEDTKEVKIDEDSSNSKNLEQKERQGQFHQVQNGQKNPAKEQKKQLEDYKTEKKRKVKSPAKNFAQILAVGMRTRSKRKEPQKLSK